MTHVDHAWRHRPKALGGTDPIEFTSGGVFTTYRDCILSDPTTLNLWPCDDASGGIVDIIGTADMTEIAWSGWPHYGLDGPFTGLPLQTAVENGGWSGPGTGEGRFSCPASLPALTDPFTLQGWLRQVHATNGGKVWEDWGGGVGAGKSLDIATTTFAISYGHGSGLTVTGGALPLATWTHVRIDYDGTTLRLFQDGVLLDTDTGSGSAAQGTCYFLNNNNFGGTGFAPFHGRAALWSLHDGVAQTCAIEGEGGSSTAPEGYGPVADGSGGVTWANIATQAELDAHVHDASAISVADVGGYYTGTEVEAVLQEIGASGGGAGVDSIAKSGSTPLTGDVTLSPGSNVTLTQVGQDIEIAGVAGSGAFGTGTSLPGSPSGGDAFFLRCGSTPFDLIALVYDATYGKWVSAPELISTKPDATTLTATSTTYANLLAANIHRIYVPWKTLSTAGLVPQIRWIGRVGRTAGANTASFGVVLIGTEGATFDTSAVFAEVTGVTAAATMADPGWTAIPGGLTVRDYLTVDFELKIVTSGTAAVFEFAAYVRWVA